MATTNSTSETAKENFITDHGSIRLRCNRARRGPRVAAPATVARAERRVSETRAAPTAALPGVRDGAPTTEVAPVVGRTPVPAVLTDDVATTAARPTELGLVAVLADQVRPAELVEAPPEAVELVAAVPVAVEPVRVMVRPPLAGTPTT